MRKMVFQLDELCTVAQIQISNLKAVESSFRTGKDAVDKDSFVYPVNGLEDTLQSLSTIVSKMFDAIRNQEVA